MFSLFLLVRFCARKSSAQLAVVLNVGVLGFGAQNIRMGKEKGGVVPGEQKAGPWGLGRKKNQGNRLLAAEGVMGQKYR